MQPRTLLILLIILPILASNGAYLISAYEGSVVWCIPYFEGCTTISGAGRSGNAIFLFRVAMLVYSVLLVFFWIYVKHWLQHIDGEGAKLARIILWLGVTGALALMVYIDFLGSSGEVNRFMRRYGVMLYFTLTPLAQLLLLKRHYALLSNTPEFVKNSKSLGFQRAILLLMLLIAIISIVLALTQSKTYESENIVEWNFSLLLHLYFAGMFVIWKDYRVIFTSSTSNR